MSLHQNIREYLDASTLSPRALSMQAGLNPKAVSDILTMKSRRPDRRTLDALGGVMGKHLDADDVEVTYAQLIAQLSQPTGDETVDRRNATLVSRLRKLLRAANWVAETEVVDRRKVIDQFATWTPATLNLRKSSFGTYKSDILSALSTVAGRSRPVGVRDLAGPYRAIHDRIGASDLPQDLKLISGSFLCFLHRHGLEPFQITPGVLEDYYRHRLSASSACETACKKHVQRIAMLCQRLAVDPAFEDFGFPAVSHPFEDGRNKYGVTAATFTGLLDEFDGPVTRWARGLESREGLSYDDFLTQLDATEPERPLTGKMALLGPDDDRSANTEAERRSAGFLLPDETWNTKTLSNRRGVLLAGAKALYAAKGFQIESIEEYTKPRVVKKVLEAIEGANFDEDCTSSYAETIGKTLKKLARDYVGRGAEEVADISRALKAHATGETGIAERNKVKLRQIVGDRQQRLIDLPAILIDGVNEALDRKAKRRRGVPRRDLLGVEGARDVMCAVAADILLARAPRKANVLGIRLSWISWAGDRARIVIPNVEVKLRSNDDPDLHIPLDEQASQRLRHYIEKVRPMALRAHDARNPFLFPAQGASVAPGRPYTGLLDRLMRHTTRVVGIRLNPHLFRHFLGWLWLREDPDRLPDVQRLLGHKSLETTLAHYAEIDENLALERWQKYLAEKKSPQPKALKKRKK